MTYTSEQVEFLDKVTEELETERMNQIAEEDAMMAMYENQMLSPENL